MSKKMINLTPRIYYQHPGEGPLADFTLDEAIELKTFITDLQAVVTNTEVIQEETIGISREQIQQLLRKIESLRRRIENAKTIDEDREHQIESAAAQSAQTIAAQREEINALKASGEELTAALSQAEKFVTGVVSERDSETAALRARIDKLGNQVTEQNKLLSQQNLVDKQAESTARSREIAMQARINALENAYNSLLEDFNKRFSQQGTSPELIASQEEVVLLKRQLEESLRINSVLREATPATDAEPVVGESLADAFASADVPKAAEAAEIAALRTQLAAAEAAEAKAAANKNNFNSLGLLIRLALACVKISHTDIKVSIVALETTAKQGPIASTSLSATQTTYQNAFKKQHPIISGLVSIANTIFRNAQNKIIIELNSTTHTPG